MHAENQLPRLPVIALKVCAVVGGLLMFMWSQQLVIGLKLGCDNYQSFCLLSVDSAEDPKTSDKEVNTMYLAKKYSRGNFNNAFIRLFFGY